jgi:hypothetical protein
VQLFTFRHILQDLKSTQTHKIFSNHVLRSECLRSDKAIRLLALDFLFDDMSSALDVSSQAGIVSSLELFYEYSLLMRDAALDKTPWDSQWLTQVFQFEKDGEGIRIKLNTFLYRERRTRGPSSSQSVEDLKPSTAASLSREELTRNLGRFLAERLRSRIADKDRILSRLRLFNPCVQLVLYGSCRGEHSAAHELDESWFNRRVRFYLQYIMTLDNLHAFDLVDDFPARIKSRR